ncbi:MAG: class I SAM-dependent methyltransferase [Deltaproteobacteria bacterium]|jgi:2-polyprenyl-3-methyl-5-hydroxy-6-metoxy-1,4-benzoquinol methylase|nr:class I SAM-dependent methyltransferase [Deltaproteobacteria bacterium]
MNETIDYYSEHSEQFARRYEKIKPQAVHAAWKHLLPDTKSKILDVGAGSGRDAGWLAGRGHNVVAVEPADNLRKKAIGLHPHDAIHWVNDRLPDLKEVHRLEQVFDVILVSAVWMHLARSDRSGAFDSVYRLLDQAGIMMISFRKGTAADRPAMYPVTGDEIRALARQYGLEVVINIRNDDLYNRTEVHWETFVLKHRI